MVAHEEKGGDVVGGKAIDTPGEFPLLGLGGLAGLVGITAEKDQVYFVLQCIIYDFVQRREEVEEARGQSGRRLDTSVALHAEMQIGKVKYFQLRSLYI
jgi:hypothetical protein